MLSVYPSKSNLSSLKTLVLFLYFKKNAYLCSRITSNGMQKTYHIKEKMRIKYDLK